MEDSNISNNRSVNPEMYPPMHPFAWNASNIEDRIGPANFNSSNSEHGNDLKS